TATTIKMFMRRDHTIITDDIPLKLHFSNLSFFGKQMKIPIDRCERDVVDFLSRELIDLFGRRMSPGVFYDLEHNGPLLCRSSNAGSCQLHTDELIRNDSYLLGRCKPARMESNSRVRDLFVVLPQ